VPVLTGVAGSAPQCSLVESRGSSPRLGPLEGRHSPRRCPFPTIGHDRDSTFRLGRTPQSEASCVPLPSVVPSAQGWDPAGMPQFAPEDNVPSGVPVSYLIGRLPMSVPKLSRHDRRLTPRRRGFRQGTRSPCPRGRELRPRTSSRDSPEIPARETSANVPGARCGVATAAVRPSIHPI
jgi:hypothetical protein